jgi:thymidylate synthase (FAD)
MKIVDQHFVLLNITEKPLILIESAGRTCYKSENRITPKSSEKFVNMITERGHHSVIEHASATVKFITNRGVTHELVRHRLCAFSQESTRYVNYGGSEMQFIKPVWWKDPNIEALTIKEEIAQDLWKSSMEHAELCYTKLLQAGWRPEQAREVLPNSLKTEIIVTANLREWRHIFTLRTSKAAHPQMRALMISCLAKFKAIIPVLFDSI